MRHFNNILAVVVAMIFVAACHSDEMLDTREGHQLLRFPVVVSTTAEAAAAGEEMKPPTCLYTWAVLNMKADDDTEPTTWMFFRRIINEFWEQDASLPSNALTTSVTIDIGSSRRFRLPDGFTTDPSGAFTCGYIYALGTKFDLDQLLPTALTDSIQRIDGGMDQALKMIEDMTLDLTKVHTSMYEGVSTEGLPNGEQGFSSFLSTLYSSPKALKVDYAKIISNSDNFYILQLAPQLQLRPCASLVECEWEITPPSKLTPYTEQKEAIATVMLQGLPTQFRVFETNQNPVGTADTQYNCPILSSSLGEGVNTIPADSRWTGKANAYILQPANGTIPYTVTFNDKTTVSGQALRSEDNNYKIQIKR